MNKNKKRIIVVLFIILIVIIGIVVVYKLIENNEETLIERTTYEYPYKIVIKVNKNGDIYKSKIIDELTQKGPPKDEFSKVGTISNEDLIAIEDIINEMKEEELKSSKHSEDYGLSVNIGENLLYGCEYFLQEKVNKLNSIMQKYE